LSSGAQQVCRVVAEQQAAAVSVTLSVVDMVDPPFRNDELLWGDVVAERWMRPD
jgi:hypothetical protein